MINMFVPKLSVAIIWLIAIQNCMSSRYTQLSIIDGAINSFLGDEKRLWDDINSQTNLTQTQNTTLLKIFDYFDRNLNLLAIGHIEVVDTINTKLSQHVREINKTQQNAALWLKEHKYANAYTECEDIIQRIPHEIAEIFDMTKTRMFLSYIRENSDFCQTHRQVATTAADGLSLQNIVMDFYTTVAEALIKGYMSTQMAYMVLAVKGAPSQYHKSSMELSQSFSTQHRALETNVRSIVQNFSGEIWNCDDFGQEFSYTQITNFIQGYIDNEVNFNVEGSCRGSCEDYSTVHHQGCKNHTICTINYLDKNKTRCDGHVRDCTFVESNMRLCPNEDDSNQSRRYNYVRYSSGLTYGRQRYCRDEIKVKSWMRWFVECSYCFCYCDHEGPFSDRYFSLRESVSDITMNRVVTGIRFLKKGRIIHIFISERELLPYGNVKISDDNTWKSDYNFVVEDSGVLPGRDYHTLTHEDKILDLDTIRAPKNEVVTGARFRVVNGRLRFEIRTTQFDYELGTLSPEYTRTVWRGNNHYTEKEKINIENADVPTLSPEKSRRYRGDNKYIEFTPTDIHLDMAQTTVPFIDTQPVEANTPKPLQGAGIYYKSTPGYGGFIGPLIIIHD